MHTCVSTFLAGENPLHIERIQSTRLGGQINFPTDLASLEPKSLERSVCFEPSARSLMCRSVLPQVLGVLPLERGREIRASRRTRPSKRRHKTATPAMAVMIKSPAAMNEPSMTTASSRPVTNDPSSSTAAANFNRQNLFPVWGRPGSLGDGVVVEMRTKRMWC
jgi:hypothetical protein